MKEKIKRTIKSFIPWRLRYYIKIQEAKGRIHISESIKQYRTIEQYNDQLYETLSDLMIKDFKGKTICELGPGQHLSHAFLEYQMGAEKEWLMEIADFAHVDSWVRTDNLKLKREYEIYTPLPDLSARETWRTYLDKIHATYSINGIEGYMEVPDNSVDYCFSYAVFEHVRKNVFVETITQMYRFMRAGGVCYHTVDFTDHMGGGKNQLRFSEAVWEDEDHYKMDNYTNRIQCSQMCEMLKEVGFQKVKVIRTTKFKESPIKKNALSKDLGDILDEDLKIAKATIVLIK